NTSIHEGIPMSILEAMAQGIPVIAPNVGGLNEIIDNGLQGYLINDRDPKSFAERCNYLYKNKNLLKIMGNAAREKITKHFSVNQMVSRYYYLYRSVLNF
ncbi:MAG: glycosyltransferase, partial [Anaerolineales bacterium]|nr:glycosyltransferase [Anaerolineales bacterium]